MAVGILNVKLHIPGINSLKGKRQIIKSLKDRLRNTFNLSVAEIGELDQWTLSELALANVGADRDRIQSVMYKVLEYIHSDYHVEVIEEKIEFI